MLRKRWKDKVKSLAIHDSFKCGSRDYAILEISRVGVDCYRVDILNVKGTLIDTFSRLSVETVLMLIDNYA